MDLEPLNLQSSGPVQANREETRVERWFNTIALAALGFFFCFGFFHQWSRLALLFCSPTAYPFCYLLVRRISRLREPRMRQLITKAALVHLVVVTGMVVIWLSLRAVRERVDMTVSASFALVLIEGLLIAIVGHNHRPTGEVGHSPDDARDWKR